jgi:hypothetical protein
MSTHTNNPAPHAGEKEAPATPRDGHTPGMGAPPDEREPGTGPDGEALPPDAIDPAPDGESIPPLPEPDAEGVGEESGPSADTIKV